MRGGGPAGRSRRHYRRDRRRACGDHDRAPLDAAVALAEEHGVVATTKLLSGNTVDEIVTYADSLDADLTVIGSRGYGVIAGTLLGSVSRGVLRESKRPVLVVRGLAAQAVAA